MKFKKTYFLFAVLFIFWIIFISWGMFKDNLKSFTSTILSKKKGQKEVITKETKTEGEAPAPSPTQPEPAPVMVRALQVKPTDFKDSLPVMGSVKGKTEIELRFEINGVIEKIYFHEGERIKQGAVIANLDPKDAQLKISYARNKLNSAQAAYNVLQKRLEIQQKLYGVGAIIKSKLEESELELESAKFQIEQTKDELKLVESEFNKTFLYANKDGLMGPREAEEGEFVTTQDKIGSLLETSEVFVEVGVVERDIEKIKLGQKAKVYVDAYPNVTFEGTVDNIFPVIEGKSRTLTVKIKVFNPEGRLVLGMFSRAEILIVELKDALVVPSTCLISQEGLTLVPVIPSQTLKKTEEGTQTGTVYLRKVNLGYVTSDYAQVSEGLSADDLVVIETQGELKDNIKVKIVGMEEMSF